MARTQPYRAFGLWVRAWQRGFAVQKGMVVPEGEEDSFWPHSAPSLPPPLSAVSWKTYLGKSLQTWAWLVKDPPCIQEVIFFPLLKTSAFSLNFLNWCLAEPTFFSISMLQACISITDIVSCKFSPWVCILETNWYIPAQEGATLA